MIFGYENLANYLKVCKASAKTIARVRGLGIGRRIYFNYRWHRVWTLEEIHEWQKKSK